MYQVFLKKLGEIASRALAKCGEVIAKESVKQGAKIAGIVAGEVMLVVVTSLLVSNYKDRVFKVFLKKHDKEMAEKLSEQFQGEIDRMKQEIADLKLEKEEAKKRFRAGVEAICKKFCVDPKEVLKE